MKEMILHSDDSPIFKFLTLGRTPLLISEDLPFPEAPKTVTYLFFSSFPMISSLSTSRPKNRSLSSVAKGLSPGKD